MSIQDELKKEGYEFQYEHNEGEDHTEVWLHTAKSVGVRIEWFQIEEVRS